MEAIWRDTYAAMKKRSEESFHPDTQTQSYKVFLEGQRAWVKYKDTACSFYSTGEFDFNVCKAELIAQRVVDLKQLLLDLRNGR